MKNLEEVYNYCLQNGLSYDSFLKLLNENGYRMVHDISHHSVKEKLLGGKIVSISGGKEL